MQDNFLDSYLQQLQSENVQNARTSAGVPTQPTFPTGPTNTQLPQFQPHQPQAGLNPGVLPGGFPFPAPQQPQQQNAIPGIPGLPNFMGNGAPQLPGFGMSVPSLGGPQGFNMAGMAGLQVRVSWQCARWR
eukprot:286620-Pelagomonas_calceolata.AAC.14